MQNSNGGYEEDPGNYDAEEDYHEEMMEVRWTFKLIKLSSYPLSFGLPPLLQVQPDIIMDPDPEQEVEQFDSIVEEEGVDPIQA